MQNEKLLKRLYKAAQADLDAHGGDGYGDEDQQPLVHFKQDTKLGAIDKGVLDRHAHDDKYAVKVSHEHWLRIKEHQERLRKVLVFEAKKDLFEKMIMEQAALDRDN